MKRRRKSLQRSENICTYGDLTPVFDPCFYEESGRYDSGTIYVNKGLLKDWGKTKDSTMYVLIEHELSHHFDELYNDLKRQKEFVSRVCSKYWVENGDMSCIFRPGHEKGTQMYKYYYGEYEAGHQYEWRVYERILFGK